MTTDQDLQAGLAALAEQAQRLAAPPAAQLRGRADRRRRHRREAVAVAVLALATAGAAVRPLAHLGNSRQTDMAGPAVTTTLPPPDPLTGKRQVSIVPVNGDAALTVTVTGRVALATGAAGGDRSLFVPVKVRGDQYWLKTATLRVNNDPTNEPLCLAVRPGTRNAPATLVTTACDASKPAQLFRFRRATRGEAGEGAGGGLVYTIRDGAGGYLTVATSGGKAVTTTKDTAAATSFRLADRGVARLPSLD